MTADELRSQFPFYTPVIISDSTYAKPTTGWLRDKFWPWFQKQRFDLGLHRWTRKSDCDDWAAGYCYSAKICHALSVGDDAEGLAVGEFFYIGTSHVQGPHAIVVAFTESGKRYLEPQTGQLLALTPSEESSCFHVRF